VESDDTKAIFAISDGEQLPAAKIEVQLAALLESGWVSSGPRQSLPDSEFVAELKKSLNDLISLRVNHVRSWLDCNLARFQRGHAAIEDLCRRFGNMVIEMSNSVGLNVLHAISSASAAGSMRATIAANPTTSVHLIVGFVKTISYALQGTVIYRYFVRILIKYSAGHPGRHM